MNGLGLMLAKLQNHSSSEKGFTLTDLLLVIMILGILLAIAVPAYVRFRDRANSNAAEANIRAAIPAIEAWKAHNNGSAGDIDHSAMTTGYEGMTAALLRQDYGEGVKLPPAFNVATVAEATYCVDATSGTKTAHKSESSDIIYGSLCP